MSYEVKDGKYQSGRNGPKLDAFPLETMGVDQYFDIPLKANRRGQFVPEKGFNVKEANKQFAPKTFAKRKEGDVLRVYRTK
jgi:hypothetical protein